MVRHDTSQVSLEGRFGASPERVYRAWLEPAMLRRWMVGPNVRDEDLVELTIDARVGPGCELILTHELRPHSAGHAA